MGPVVSLPSSLVALVPQAEKRTSPAIINISNDNPSHEGRGVKLFSKNKFFNFISTPLFRQDLFRAQNIFV
jgi:hypothetical protein